MAGILCDGPFYWSASDARDRGRLRGQVLEGLGWNLIRIWSPECSSILHHALPGGLTNVLVVFIAQILTAAFALPMTDMHTVCTTILAVVGMLVLYRLCRPFNWFRRVLWLAMGVGLIGCFLVLGPWFDLYIATPVSYLVLAVMMTAAIGMFVVIQALFRWMDKLRKR